MTSQEEAELMRRSAAPLASIIIPASHGIECLRQCLESIERNTPQPHEIIFVPHSAEESALPWLRELCARHGRYRLLEEDSGPGFAAACNRAIAAASGKYLLLLEGNTVVTAEWLGGMLSHFGRDPGLGAVAPMSNECAGPQRVLGARYETLEELAAFACAFRSRNRGRRLPADRLAGFCLLLSRELLHAIAPLDPVFHSSEVGGEDLCLRAALAGYRCAIAGDVFVHHYGSEDPAAAAADREAFRKKWDLTALEETVAKKLVTHNAMLRGRLLFHQGRSAEGVELLLQEGIRFSPEDPAPYLLLAELLAESGGASDALDVLAHLPPGEKLRATVLEARCRLVLGGVEEVLRLADQALLLDPSCAAALHLHGEVALLAGDAPRAERLFCEAIGCDPGYPLPYRALAQLFGEKGKDEALQLAEEAYLLAPHDMESLALYHRLAVAAGATEGEEARIREALHLYPQHRGIHFALIDRLLGRGELAGAMAQIERAALAFGMDDGMIDAALSVRRQIGPRTVRGDNGPTLSLCMIVKDEAKHLPRVLSSALPLVDEMVVVDTGSGDRSAEIAELFGARLFRFPWNGSFADARNASLAQAKGEWILVLDADEALAERDLERLRALLSGEKGGYLLTTRNYTGSITRKKWQSNSGEYGAEEAGSGWTPSEKVRLFPNRPEVRFSGAVHELVEDSLLRLGLPVLPCPVPVHHYGRLDLERELEKRQRYYELGVRKLNEEGGDMKALVELAVQATELERFAEAQRLWERVLEAEPDNCDAFFNLGYIKLSSGDFADALSYSRKACERDPQLKEAAFNAAKAELYLGLSGRALASAESILTGCPGYPPALALCCACFLIEGKSGEAAELLEELRGRHFDCAEFLQEHAEGLARGGHPAQGAILRQKAQQLSGETPPGA